MQFNHPSSHTSSNRPIKASSSVSKEIKSPKKQRVNWHEAVSWAIQIELQDYAHLLEYQTEYVLGKNSYRIDLLVIKKLTVSKIAPGVYHINKETFNIQIIVTQELLPLENLYLRCLTNRLQDTDLINRLTDDYKLHQKQLIYNRYMHQLTTTNRKTKGDSIMVCEGLLNLFGTSSEEIIERTKKEDEEYYLPKLQSLSNQNNYLKSLLEQNNIPFCLYPEPGNQI